VKKRKIPLSTCSSKTVGERIKEERTWGIRAEPRTAEWWDKKGRGRKSAGWARGLTGTGKPFKEDG